MPGPATIDYPCPGSSDEFEKLATDLASRMRRHRFQRFGRRGQRQHGVDAVAQMADGRLVGLQHKNTKTLKRTALEKAIREAEAFDPPLAELVVVTAARRDAALQRIALQLTRDRLAAGMFAVAVLFWDDLCDELSGHPDLLAKYYGAQIGPLRGVGSQRAQAWVHRVINEWLEVLDRSRPHLTRGNLTWRHHTMQPECVGRLMQCAPDTPVLEDLLSARRDLKRLVESYDQLLDVANEAATVAARALSENERFCATVSECLKEYNAEERRDDPWGSHDASAFALLVAGHVVNREEALPAIRTDSVFWASFGARLRAEFADGAAMAESREKVEELARQCVELRRVLESERFTYCSRYGFAAS